MHDPVASPVHADLAALPPLLIQVGTRALLLDDATRIAAKAWQAGVDVDLQVRPGLMHLWRAMPARPESGAALRATGDFVHRHIL